MVLITVLGLTTIISLSSADMNKGVRYTIANADDPTRAYSFRDSSSYFEVKTSAMNTTYGEVFWTMLPPVDLPQNIVSDWKDKYMAITGFEVDVRRIDEITGEEQSVPVFQSYNHHYGPAIHSSYATCLGPIGEDYGHGPTVLFDLNRNVSTPPPKGTRLVTNFVHGNGNEHRQVFHGVPSGYAQIVYSPSTFTITPMQINTNDGSGHRGASGPIPKFSQESANPNGHYSALLECPCTTRIKKEIGNLTSKLVGTCDVLPIAHADCFAGAQKIFQQHIVKNVTVTSDTLPPGCFVSSDQDNKLTITFNNNRSSNAECNIGGKSPKSTCGVSETSFVKLNVTVDQIENLVTIRMEGPSDEVWFGVGFNASSMQDEPYALIILGNGTVTERKLGNHVAGSILKSSVKVLSNTVMNHRRTVVLTRALVGITSDHFTFSTSQGTIPFINAVGKTANFGPHRDRAPASLTLLSKDDISCLCAGAQGTIDGYPLNANCLAEPISDLLSTNNPTCQVSSYVGGLACCRHGTILLDTDQEDTRPKHVDSVFFRFRFYYENITVAKKVKPIYHVEWAANGCDSGLSGTSTHHCTHIEFDITTSSNSNKTQTFKSDFQAGWMLADSCDVTSPQCMDRSSLGLSGKIELVMAAAHCHAPNCLHQELIRTDTNEVLCKAIPVHGQTEDVFDELGYLSTPPCAWSNDPNDGLPKPPQLSMDTPMRMSTTFNSTYYHAGQMSIWQMKAAFV